MVKRKSTKHEKIEFKSKNLLNCEKNYFSLLGMNQAGHNPTFCSLLQGSRMLQSKVIEQSSKFAVRKSHQDSHLVPGEPRKFWALSSLAAFFLRQFPCQTGYLGQSKE